MKFDTLGRLGISDYRTYVKKILSNENVTYLNSCIVSQTILDRIEADIEECILSKSFVDLQSNLPSVLTDSDIQTILDTIMIKQNQQQTVIIDNYVISKAFIEKLCKDCEDMLKSNAETIVENGKYQEYQTELQMPKKLTKFADVEEKFDKRDERRKKAAGGKSGGGTQGRETKTKSTKKSNRSNKMQDDYDTQIVEKKRDLEMITKNEIYKIVENALDGVDDLIEPIIDYLLPILNSRGMEMAANLFATTIADRTANRRQTHNELQTKLNVLIGDVRLFEKGIKLLSGDLQTQLAKYLLKTLCTDIVNEILNYVAAEQNLNTIVDSYNNDQKMKFVNDLPNEFKTPLLVLLKTLSGQNVDEFMTCVEPALSACSMIIKKIDKKKDRTIILNHKYELLEKLNQCDDLALILHLATLAIFTIATQCMLHASGRHIAAILSFLKQYLNDEQYNEFMSYHGKLFLLLLY